MSSPAFSVASAAAVLFTVSGCGLFSKPDVAACEAHIKGSLPSPASYNRISVAAFDGATMPGKDFPAAAGTVRPRANDLDRALWDESQAIYNSSQVALRQLVVEYDAQNENGVAVRAKQICAFRLIDGQLEGDDMLMRRADRTSTADGIDLLDAVKGSKTRARPRFACCL